MTWLVACAYTLAGLALFGGLVLRADPRVLRRIGELSGAESGTLPRILRWVALVAGKRGGRRRMERRLEAAGLAPDAVEAYLGLKVAGSAAGALLGLSTWPAGPPPAVLIATALGVAGFGLPDFVLARRAARLRAQAARGVSDLLDVLAVCATAGLTPQLALERAAGALEGPLAVVLAEMRSRVALGTPWRRVLWETAERLELGDLRRLARILDRARRLGVPVAEQIRRLAADVRSERRAAAEERARRAPVTMLFPLVFLILPAFILAAVIPAIIVAARGIP